MPTHDVDPSNPGSRDVPRDSEATLIQAWTTMAGVEAEIDRLWQESIRVEDPAFSERLVGVSHAVKRALRLLDQDGSIG